MTGPATSVDFWTKLNTCGTLATAVAAILGLGFVGYQLYQNSKALQLQVLEGIFRDIRELDRTWIEKKFLTEMPAAEKAAWCSSFFNTIEYLCFLINWRMVRSRELRDFFIVGLRVWWSQFENYREQRWITDTPDMFKEFKVLCKRERITSHG